MKLYLISQSECDGYDTYDSAIVAATNEDAARAIHPSERKDWTSGTWADSPEKVRSSSLGRLSAEQRLVSSWPALTLDKEEF